MAAIGCMKCGNTGWLEPIGPCGDGSYVTSRPCNCEMGRMVATLSWPTKAKDKKQAQPADDKETS